MRRLLSLVFVLSLLLLLYVVLRKSVLFSFGDRTNRAEPSPLEPRLPVTKAGLYECLDMFREHVKEGAGDNRQYEINLKSGSFIPKPNYFDVAKCLELARDARKYYVVVQLWDVPVAEDKKTLEASGIKLLGYLDGNAWFAEVTNFRLLEGDKILRWVGIVRPEEKMSPEVASGNFGMWSLEGDKVLLIVKVFPSVDRGLFEKKLGIYGVEVVGDPIVWPDNISYTVKTPRDRVRDLSLVLDEIYYIDLIPPPPVTQM